MSKLLKLLISVFSLCFVLLTCKNQDDSFIAYNIEPPDTTIQLDISPPTVRVGFAIAITGAKFNNSQYDYHVIFPDSTTLYPNSISEDTMFVIVPYVTQSGTLKVTSYNFEAEGLITILNDCKQGVCVEDWDLNYTITEKNSWTPSPFGYDLKWSVQSCGDTIFIKKEGRGPNYDMHRDIYFLNDSSNTLPNFIEGEIYIYGSGSAFYQIDRAVIKIQDWNIHGILSGVLFFTPVYYSPFIDVFWVDMRRNNKPK